MTEGGGGSRATEIEVVESKVTFTTKELLARIDLRFEHLESIAEAAATRGDVSSLVFRVDKLERDAEGTKAVASALLLADKGRWSKNEKIVGLVFAVVALSPSVIDIVNVFQ